MMSEHPTTFEQAALVLTVAALSALCIWLLFGG